MITRLFGSKEQLLFCLQKSDKRAVAHNVPLAFRKENSCIQRILSITQLSVCGNHLLEMVKFDNFDEKLNYSLEFEIDILT